MNEMKSRKAVALLLALVSMVSVFAVCGTSGDDSDAANGNTYTYTISASTGAISGGYTHIGSSSTGSYGSTNNTNSGSWTFDDSGYGPFNSFYAAFDPAQNNKMICHLDPDNLMMSVDGKTDITGKSYNIMWCLPTVYWKTDSSGNLILTNDSSAGGTAYAHTVYDTSGNAHTYAYVAYGVYEAGTASINGSTTILTSYTGSSALVSKDRPTFRDYANNQSVNTDGEGTNGYAMLWNFYQYELYKYCAIAVMGGWDSQSIAGNGYVFGDANPYYKTTGLLNTSGPYAGTRGSGETYYKDSVKVFLENVWGSVYDFVDGIVFNGRAYCIDQKVVPTDSYSSGTGMTILSKVLPSSGWGSSPSTDAQIWGMPTANSGSSSSGLYDYVYSNSGQRSLVVGGCSSTSSSGALYYGLSFVYGCYSLGNSVTGIGGRLAFVFDADPAATTVSKVTYNHDALANLGASATAIAGLPTEIEIEDETTTYTDLGTVEGYTHIGWYVNGTFYSVNHTVVSTEDHKAYSAWKAPSVTITFMVEGEVHSTLEVPKGSVGIVYTPVQVEGVFMGWYYDASYTNKYDATKPFDEDAELYAKGVKPLTFTSVPTANATITNIDANGLVYFDATDNAGRLSVLWDFGDGNTSTDAIAYNSYAQPGTYDVTLTVTNALGETAQKTYQVVYAGPDDSPNDGKDPTLLYAIIGLIVLVALISIARRFI